MGELSATQIFTRSCWERVKLEQSFGQGHLSGNTCYKTGRPLNLEIILLRINAAETWEVRQGQLKGIF